MTANSPRSIPLSLLVGLALTLTAAAPAEVRMPIREFDAEGFHVRLDLSRQVLEIKIPEDRDFGVGKAAEPPITATLPAGNRSLLSASILAQKAKQFDDGLYAAVELAAQQGAGKFAGKAALLRTLAEAMGRLDSSAIAPESPPAVVLAAGRLGDPQLAVPAGAKAAVNATVDAFLKDPLRSKPIGFYTWSPALEAIFRQDRMLQTELKGKDGIAAVAQALHADPKAQAAYEAYLNLVARLTNPLTSPSLLGVVKDLDAGRAAPEKGVAFFPASQAHETELVKRLYGDRPIPDGFNLVDEMIKRIEAGTLDLRPTTRSGWYDHQTWALEPLVSPERTPESARLQLDASYRKQLRELFKGILALTRETHIKQLEVPMAAGAAPVERGPVEISVAPELAAEPLPTYYQRRGESYRFIRNVLDEAFGADALGRLHRQTAAGPVAADLAAELEQMQSLFLGAAVKVRRQLGMADEPGANAGDVDRFERWAATRADDPDVGRDVRMMVPLFYDLGRRKTKVWVFLGWSERPVRVRFATPPTAEITRQGRPADAKDVVLQYNQRAYRLPYPVTAEVYVNAILDRNEFRRHCDTYKTQTAILKNLR